jgi:hypothetical protein
MDILPVYSADDAHFVDVPSPEYTRDPLSQLANGNPLRPHRILIRIIRAYRISYFQWEFSSEIPGWYLELDTIGPGFSAGIEQCNQALKKLAFRKVLLISYQLFLLSLAIICVSLFVAGVIGVAYRIFFYAITFPVLVILFFTRPAAVKWILTFKSPMIELRNNVTMMGWTLSGFEEAHRNFPVTPEITVSRNLPALYV